MAENTEVHNEASLRVDVLENATLRERVAALTAENERLTKERDDAREYGVEVRILCSKAEDARIHWLDRAEKAEAALAQRGEPVAWQYRYRADADDEWSEWMNGKGEQPHLDHPHQQIRQLYPAPPASAASIRLKMIDEKRALLRAIQSKDKAE